MKPMSRIMTIMAFALVFSGCAGFSAQKTPPVAQPLPEMVPESFHFNLQDAATRRYLDDLNPDSMPPNQRLEVLLLRELAGVSAEKELVKVFDRLWEEQAEIKGLVLRPEQREGFSHPLAEIYYLLSAGAIPSWRTETAEQLYQETLSRLEPPQLSGYALHFYTLALLKNGKFDVALSFLRRLESFNPSRVYLENLTIALAYAMAGGADQVACRLMVVICGIGARNNLEFPEEELKAAIIALKKAGKLELARKVLLPVVQNNPQFQKYSFVQVLKQSQDSDPGGWQIKKFAAAAVENGRPVAGKTPGKPCVASSSRVGEHTNVRIEVKVIKAGRRSNYVDPALAAIGESLRETLNFSSLTLIAERIFNLGIGEKGDLPLPRGHALQVILRSLTSEISRIEVAILKGNQEVFHTVVESIDGGITTIGGPQAGDGVLLLRIRVEKKPFDSAFSYDNKTLISKDKYSSNFYSLLGNVN